MQELHATALEMRILLAIASKWSARCLEDRLQEHGMPISSLQYGVMRVLCHKQHTISEISRKMTLSPATLVPAVDSLERHGLVERGRDPKDRRRTPLVLTEKGSQILDHIPSVDDGDVLVQGLAALGLERRRQLLELIRELVRAMPDGDSIVAEVSSSVGRADEAGRRPGDTETQRAGDT